MQLAGLDALDLVSLLLGAAISLLAIDALVGRVANVAVWQKALLALGLTLILSYFFSEVSHAFRAARDA